MINEKRSVEELLDELSAYLDKLESPELSFFWDVKRWKRESQTDTSFHKDILSSILERVRSDS